MLRKIDLGGILQVSRAPWGLQRLQTLKNTSPGSQNDVKKEPRGPHIQGKMDPGFEKSLTKFASDPLPNTSWNPKFLSHWAAGLREVYGISGGPLGHEPSRVTSLASSLQPSALESLVYKSYNL